MEKKGTKKITIVINTEFSQEKIKATIDELCTHGISRGCYQDTTALLEVLSIMTQAEKQYDSANGRIDRPCRQSDHCRRK